MASKRQSRIFFDTNILVYQFDRAAPAKQQQAIALIEQGLRKAQAVISTQVVQEFMNVALKKFKVPLTPAELALVQADLLRPLCAHTPDADFYERALRLYEASKASFYDALIIQAALDLGCETLYSEDMHSGQQFGMLTIKNPFI